MNKKSVPNETDAVTKKASVKKSVSKKTVAKKQAVAKKATAKKAVAKKAVSKKPAEPAKKTLVSPRERYEMIATMAYYRAEQRNFAPGDAERDWYECEKIVDKMLDNQ